MAAPLEETLRQTDGAPATAPHRTLFNKSAGTGRTGVEVRRITDPSQWSNLLGRVPFPHMTQSFAYGEGKRANGWRIARVAFVRHGETIAICQIQERRIASVRVASRVNRGPVFLDAAPDASLVTEVYRQLRKCWGRVLTGPLLIAPALLDTEENRKLLLLAGYHLRSASGWYSARVDLKPSEDQIFAGFSSPFRNRYRRAEKQGVTFEIANSAEAVEWLIRRNSENLKALGVGHNDESFFRALAKVPGDRSFIMRAIFNGEFVGGTAVILSGCGAEYNVGWHSAGARNLNLGNYLMWNAMREAKRRGSTVFDIGGLGEEKGGFSRFKRELNGTEYRLIGEHISLRMPSVRKSRHNN
jgi:hypothetical protein